MSVERIGLTVLHRPATPEDHKLDIVFVHGLFGHPKNTWTCNIPANLPAKAGVVVSAVEGGSEDGSREPPHKKARIIRGDLLHEVYWPRDLLPGALPQSRILTWGYDVQIEQMFSSTSQASVFHHAEALLSDLTTLRCSATEKARPLMFIAHSLGGIVVKDALNLSRTEPTFLNEILPATAGVIFLGTPHSGSKIASLGKVAFELSRVFFQEPNVKILRAIEENSEILERITRSFGQILAGGRIKVHSFREELETRGMMIVDASSSTIGYPMETRGSIHANHRNMAKFSSFKDIGFQRLLAVLQRWIQEPRDPEVPQPQEWPDDRISNDLYKPSSEEYDLCLKSLNCVEARGRLLNVEKAYGETCSWLFKEKVGFEDWLTGKTRDNIYWIQGKPASGKSTVMKFAMNHPLTMELLQKYSSDDWIVIGYFFHDRGTMAQKSVEGFLREVLYQVLRQRMDLFQIVSSVFSDMTKTALHQVGQAEIPILVLTRAWRLHELRDVLLSIGTKSQSAINICLFVDALDEHDGNHRDLLTTLKDLSISAEKSSLRLRLCLASRPEGIFKNVLRSCPGFAIHEFTTDDIRLVATGRMQMEWSGEVPDSLEPILQELIEEIIEKAHGVFLWVKLVVDELVEGLCEGDSIEELKELLWEIPTELEELFTRAIRRTRRSSSRVLARQRLEAYIMFQVATCSPEPLTLPLFLRASLHLTTRQGTYAELQRLTEVQMEHRLNSRSAGLLEATVSGRWDGQIRIVQFIHQTAKEFITTGKGAAIICEGATETEIPRESGFLLILRYIVSLFGTYNPAYIDDEAQTFAICNFAFYAHKVELDLGLSVGKLLEKEMLSLREDWFYTTIRSLCGAWANPILERGDRHAQLLLFYILSSLPLSLATLLQSYQIESASDSGLLLLAALRTLQKGRDTYRNSCAMAEMRFRVLEVLLRAGGSANISTDAIGSCDGILKERLADPAMPQIYKREIAGLWAKIKDERSEVRRRLCPSHWERVGA